MESDSVSKSAQVHADTSFYRRALYTFSGAHFLNDLVTTGMVPALVVMYKHALHLNYTQSTLIVLVSYITSSVIQPIFGMLTDRRPRVWLFSLGVFLSISGLALTGIAPSLGWLLLFIAISGFGSGVFHPEASRGTHFASGSKKGLAQAIFQVGGNAGQAFGPLMIPLFLIHTGIHGLIWLIPIAFLSLILTVPLLRWLNGKVQAGTKKKTIEGENNIPGVIMLILVIILRSWCQIGVVIFLPFYMSHLSIQASETLNFIFVGAGALGTLFGGMISDRLGMKRLLVVSMFLATPFALILPHLHGVLAVLDLLFFGFSVLSSFSVSVVYMQKLLPKNIALASGLSIGFGVGAGGIGSVFMGGISDVFGVATVFTILSVLPLIGAIISWLLPNEKTLGKTA
ncbi:MFS transporter [Heyndrickxia ginsengihumi]|uniref:MFS transporter n=1 Tax=Heyndrickxia ginsengihumi TaxID=363870 RepID=A0A6M0PAU7_9BACI|nr:MFS transporter [Heyndrickxia ginsengihumi]MBE6185490.1 MFS transporter [Bacillus sp. (in: firmicutes)]MCM3023416.1 MFS transporter [Heyndrickxia ginsengihumi]NEY21563.1 MFS transporter [Heyndrickxia ginsengihumi]